jgi:membrane protease subunit (stomatin/prohibitin family)
LIGQHGGQQQQEGLMGLMKKLRGELVDIIEWIDDSRSTLAWRYPRYQNEIKNGAELIVREGQKAVFVYRGSLADQFEPGHYTLDSENLPLLSTLQGWKHGFDSPFRSEVYFINTRPVTDLRWGTPQPITVRDPDFKMVQVRANGLCVVKVEDPEIFLREVIGTDSAVEIDEITELLRRVIITAFSDMVMESGLGAIDLQGQQRALSEKLRDYVEERVDDEYGLSIPSMEMKISLPEEITEAMTRGVAKGVETSGYIDNVSDVGKLQQVAAADAMTAAASNPGGGGTMGDMMGMGMGLAMANQMAQTMGGSLGGPASAPAAAAPPPLPSYHVALNGQQAGPFTIEQMRAGLANGEMKPTDLVWTNGMAGWVAANEVAALAELFATPPPLPNQGTPPPVPPTS